MDRKSASATPANAAKKDESFFSKTAHTILDKVHGLTDDVKGKTHKNKKEKDPKKKTDGNAKTSAKPQAAAKNHSSSDSDDEDDSPNAPHPTTTSTAKQNTERRNSKPDVLASKPTASAATTLPPSKNSSNKLVSNDTGNPSSDEPKDTAATAKLTGNTLTAKSSLPSSKNDSKPTTEKQEQVTGQGDTTKKPPPVPNNKDRVHISFEGVSTVDDLLDRIDEALEKVKLTLENEKGPVNINLPTTSRAPVPSSADLEKVPRDDDNEEEPIRIDYNEIHRIDDLILKVNQLPGHRKVIIENAPKNTSLVPVPSTSKKAQVNDDPIPPTTTTENDDPSGPPKSILKSSQDPSSLGTLTKTASFQDDQIHANIEDVQGVEDLVDRAIRAAVNNMPAAVAAKTDEEKRRAPEPPNQSKSTHPSATATSVSNPKREAPKAPPPTNEQSNDDANLPRLAVSKFPPTSHASAAQRSGNEKEDNIKGSTSEDLKQTSTSSTEKKKKEEGENTVWI